MTGCRRSEVLGLRWEWIVFERAMIFLPDSKTGPKPIYLNAPALDVLANLPRQVGNPHVICGHRDGGAFVGLDKVWRRVTCAAELDRVRLHDLRHSFASIGAAGGNSLLILGKLLGHRHAATTERYSHLSADPMRQAAEAIGQRIKTALDGSKRPKRRKSQEDHAGEGMTEPRPRQRLIIPIWVPPSARRKIEDLWGDPSLDASARAALIRLATYPAVHTDVWDKLPLEPEGAAGGLIECALIAIVFFPTLRPAPHGGRREAWERWDQYRRKHPMGLPDNFYASSATQLSDAIRNMFGDLWRRKLARRSRP